MIIFTPIKEIPEDLLFMKGIQQVFIYNLTSYVEGPPKLNLLIPSPDYIPENVLTGDCCDTDFDQAYHTYIINNQNAFLQFMSIVVPEFSVDNPLTVVLISNSPYRDAIAESLMKLIQQRYGISSYYVQDKEDFYYIDFQEPSIPGVFTADHDLDRWRTIMTPPGREDDFF